MFPFALLVGSAALLAAFLSCFDVATKAKEPIYALRTKEWWWLVSANFPAACAVIYVAQVYELIDLRTFAGWISAVIGYPLLLNTKLFSLGGKDEDTPIGPQLLLRKAEGFLLPGIEKSIDEKAAKWANEWRSADLSSVGRFAKDYVSAQQSLNDEDKGRTLTLIDGLVAEVEQTPGRKNDNAMTLLVKIREIGGLRGVNWILRQSNKERQKKKSV